MTVDGDTLRADFGLGKLAILLGVEPTDAIEETHSLAIAARPRRRGREIRMLVEGNEEVPKQRGDGRLVMLLLKAQAARQQLVAVGCGVAEELQKLSALKD